MSKLDMAAIVEFLKQHLKIETKHTNGRLEILLKLDGETISSDFIDYSDVFRVIRTMNSGTFH